MFSSCNPKFFAVRHIQYPVNTSSDHFHSDAVVPLSLEGVDSGWLLGLCLRKESNTDEYDISTTR